MTGPKRPVPEDVLRQLAEEIRVWRQEASREPGAVNDATLAAYAAGTLAAARREWVEEQLAASPDLAEIAGVVRETLERGDWHSEGADLAPTHHLPLILGPLAPAVVPAEPWAEPPVRWLPRWAAAAALAASVLLGVGMGAGAVAVAPWLHDAFHVSTEQLGGDTGATLDSGITDSAAGRTRRGLSDLKDLKDTKDTKAQKDAP